MWAVQITVERRGPPASPPTRRKKSQPVGQARENPVGVSIGPVAKEAVHQDQEEPR
jgi:hypothetical protein